MSIRLCWSPAHPEQHCRNRHPDARSSDDSGASIDVSTVHRSKPLSLEASSNCSGNASGLSVVRSGDIGGIASIFTRGGESDYTKILVDGIPVNQPGGTMTFHILRPATLTTLRLCGARRARCLVPMRSPELCRSLPGLVEGLLNPNIRLKADRSPRRTSREPSAAVSANSISPARSAGSIPTTFGPNNDYRNATYSGNFGFTPDSRQSIRATLMDSSVKAGTPV